MSRQDKADLLNPEARTEVLEVLAADEAGARGVALSEELLKSESVGHSQVITSHDNSQQILNLSCILYKLQIVLHRSILRLQFSLLSN